MKYIKNGKVVLDGTIKECDLEEKLLRVLEIIVDKKVNIDWLWYCFEIFNDNDGIIAYNDTRGDNDDNLTENEYKLIKEITQ